MLDYIRSNTQSFGVKLAFGLIILVFVFWGVGSLTDKNVGNVVAMINTDPLLLKDFETAYRNAEESAIRQRPGITREQLKKEGLGRRVLQDLVVQILLDQEARRNGIGVSDVELRQAVGRIQAFQKKDGTFDPEAYQNILTAQRTTPAQYESELRTSMLRQKIFSWVVASAWSSPDRPRELFNFIREKRKVDYVFHPASDFAQDYVPTDADISAYYDAHINDFAIPLRGEVEYLAVGPDLLVRPEDIPDEDVQKRYESHPEQYTEKEQVKASHILLPLSQDADEQTVNQAMATMKVFRGQSLHQDFASLADKYNPKDASGPGGELGWIPRGVTVPAFEEAAFALEPGEVSEIVRTPFGLHLIKVTEKKPEALKPLGEVEKEIRATLALERGEAMLHDVLDSLIEDAILGKPLAASAERHRLEVGKTELATQEQLAEALGISPADAATILSLRDGAVSDAVIEGKGRYLIVKMVQRIAPTSKSLSEVRGEIADRLKQEKGLLAAMEKAGAEAKELSGDGREAQEARLTPKESGPVERGGALPGFLQNDGLVKAIFEADERQWLPGPTAVVSETAGPGAILCRIAAIVPPDDKEWETLGTLLANISNRERVDGYFQVFVQDMLSRAKVEIVNADVIERNI
ncbi:MAG: SurA N-terminal domain-containing protein [Desulfovibrio sp.]|jgi:peptidyl-prolyl cis-trans isomerase D|nr:SurA N-terminal domain-containing protein [Desulfovibrio sp.]